MYRAKTGYNVDAELLRVDIDTPLSQIAQEVGMSYLSTIPSFRADGCPGCYYPWDTHLTPLGNERVAQLLARELPRLIPKISGK